MFFEDRPGDVFRWLNEKQPLEIMQFTGLLDKNGKEIYEGDIIVKIINGERRYPSSIERKMTNNCGECGWVYGWDMPDHAETIAQEYEVIGNIHENPELLK